MDTKIPIRCPHCGQRFKISSRHLGRDARCKTCGGKFLLSESTAEATLHDTNTTIAQLERDKNEAVRTGDYVRAAKLRDQLFNLRTANSGEQISPPGVKDIPPQVSPSQGIVRDPKTIVAAAEIAEDLETYLQGKSGASQTDSLFGQLEQTLRSERPPSGRVKKPLRGIIVASLPAAVVGLIVYCWLTLPSEPTPPSRTMCHRCREAHAYARVPMDVSVGMFSTVFTRDISRKVDVIGASDSDPDEGFWTVLCSECRKRPATKQARYGAGGILVDLCDNCSAPSSVGGSRTGTEGWPAKAKVPLCENCMNTSKFRYRGWVWACCVLPVVLLALIPVGLYSASQITGRTMGSFWAGSSGKK